MTLVSVIIPVFNRPASALRAASSALTQAGLGSDNLELILVDDCSSPPLALPELPSDSARIIRLDKNAGPAAARNAGILASRGDFIAFLDSDDVWLPEKLAAQMTTLRSSTINATDLVCCACGFYYPNRRTRGVEARMPMPGTSALEFASGCWSAPGTTLVVPRSTFDRIGFLDDSLRRLEDYDWLLRFGLAGGRLVVAEEMGAVIAPSGLARAEIVERSIGQLEAKYSAGGTTELKGLLARRFAAYMALERGAALLADGIRLAGATQLARSIISKPRLTAAVCRFWDLSRPVPPDAARIYNDLAVLRT